MVSQFVQHFEDKTKMNSVNVIFYINQRHASYFTHFYFCIRVVNGEYRLGIVF